MTNEDAALTAREAAANVIRLMAEPDSIPKEIELTNGTRLRFKPVPPLLMRQIVVAVPEPAVPMWHNEERDEDVPNPSDPDYLKALQKYEDTVMMAMADACLMVGTEIISLPDGVIPPDSDDWITLLRSLRIKFDEEDLSDPNRRYLLWLRLYALQTNSDIARTTAGPMLLVGLSESEVIRAIDSFRGNTGRSTDNGVPAEQPVASQNGHRVPAPVARNRAGNRRARSG